MTKPSLQTQPPDHLAVISTHTLDPLHTLYLQAATRPNTRRAYRQDIQHFVASGGLLPATPESVIRYLHTFATSLNPRTLSRHLTAIKQWHLYQGFSDPTNSPFVRKTLLGIQKTHGQPPQKSPAMTIEYLSRIVAVLLADDTLIAHRNNALLQVGFFGAFRRSELALMQWEHIHFSSEGVEILIPRSKGDPKGEGHISAIPQGHASLCAVTALKKWKEKSKLESGSIFRAINRHDQMHAQSLTAHGINLIIKKLAVACQLPQAEAFSAHSLRRGFATETSKSGASFASIMRHGRWRHEKTVLGYIEEGQRFQDNAAKHLITHAFSEKS